MNTRSWRQKGKKRLAEESPPTRGKGKKGGEGNHLSQGRGKSTDRGLLLEDEKNRSRKDKKKKKEKREEASPITERPSGNRIGTINPN